MGFLQQGDITKDPSVLRRRGMEFSPFSVEFRRLLMLIVRLSDAASQPPAGLFLPLEVLLGGCDVKLILALLPSWLWLVGRRRDCGMGLFQG